jgi:hypothetical protein
MRRSLSLILILLLLPGCNPYSQEELDRLVKEDPAFRQMIASRDQAHSQIKAVKDDLLAKKKVMDSQVEKLRADYDAYAKAQNAKTEKFRASIDVHRAALAKDIEISSASLQSKVTELNGYQKTLIDVKKVIRESKGISLTKQERQRWEERVLMLSEKIRPLSDEVQELKYQIRLKKQKLSYLK